LIPVTGMSERHRAATLPPAREESTDLEVSGGDVDRLGEAPPVEKVVADLPVRVAVIDDEQPAAGFSVVAHRLDTPPAWLASRRCNTVTAVAVWRAELKPL